MALGLMSGLQAAGRRIPGDVSVIGFDDVPEAAFFSPPLTTVRQDFARVGALAIEHLDHLLAGREQPGPTVITPELVVRQSVAAGPVHPTLSSLQV
jgi:DNA-binding LacI/PurR family transcriptional regulator